VDIVKNAFVLLTVVLALLAAPVALAGSGSVLTEYGTAGSQPVVQVKGSTASTTPKSSPSQLPFTGTDLLVFVVAGTALMGVGFGMRRLGREKE
jgi:hypothetical protein